ncbi:hypothetical protein CspeluHIS016_0801960 [Cutaneotrichosporon spelunceum]|uniref:Microtubule associated protein n=1 Tax=Cutaneotrichosporon spelunceum TaxID=1672016 RepID=A0AAD3TZY4_9TREE|nr:hypothetical protein CspeluHIS016_0801960 [Cutaneotrichosporon spelunceum]
MDMDASSYIAEQIPLLRRLHQQLALAPTALAEDTARIDTAVRAAIVSVVRGREDEVAVWEARIADGKRALAGLARAVGEKGRSVVNANRRESEPIDDLPAQHERLVEQTAELEVVYNERLAQIEELRSQLEKLSTLLGSPYEPPAPLTPIPGLAVPARKPRPSMAATLPPPVNLAPTINKRTSGRRASAFHPPAPEPETPKLEAWLDVGEDVQMALEAAVEKALEERDARLRTLEATFIDLIWYRAELDLQTLERLPPEFRPPLSEEEQPGVYSRYEAYLNRVISLNPVKAGSFEDEEQGIEGMEGIEPEVGLINWADTLLQLWTEEKEERDEQIQALYEHIEPLWDRLKVEQEYINSFTERNVGSGLTSIQAYEEELERMLEKRKASLSTFIINVRKEIGQLQDELLLSDDEKAQFGAFINDEYSEELLEEHEEEAARLRALLETSSVHLARVKEWLAIKADEEELERSAADPNRFKKRGTAMLQEERMRKRVEKRKPKIEADLLASLPSWEEEHGRPFLARGERVVDIIQDALAAKEAAREAKKRAKLGLGPATAPRARATPAIGSRSQPATLRKRELPTPCSAGGSTSKRPRVIGARFPSGLASRSVSGTSARSVSGSGARPASSMSLRGSTRQVDETPTASAARRFGAPAGSRANALVPRQQDRADVFKTPGKTPGRTPRKSFKPRRSIAGGLLAGRFVLAEADEDDDMF